MTTRRGWLVFSAVATTAGVVFWWQADWWAYVEFPDGPMPKFELPWWVQLPVSVLVGCFWGGVGVGITCLVPRRWLG